MLNQFRRKPHAFSIEMLQAIVQDTQKNNSSLANIRLAIYSPLLDSSGMTKGMTSWPISDHVSCIYNCVTVKIPKSKTDYSTDKGVR